MKCIQMLVNQNVIIINVSYGIVNIFLPDFSNYNRIWFFCKGFNVFD